MTIRPVRFFFLTTVFCATFEKLSWNVAGNVSLADILAIGFIVAFALQEIDRGDRTFVTTAAVVGCFLALFLLVYLAGCFTRASGQAVRQYWKGFLQLAIP